MVAFALAAAVPKITTLGIEDDSNVTDVNTEGLPE